jgi:hypothetical protein
MLKATSPIRRLDPRLRGAIVLYLLSTLCLVAVHQHHSAFQGHDCALCTVAHTPVTVAPAALYLVAPASTGYLSPILSDHRWESEPVSTSRTRAPPLV